MLSRLDWKTPAKRADFTIHSRVYSSMLAFGAASFFLWSVLYPNTFWFLRLWAGLTSGAFSGFVVGTLWQLMTAERRTVTSGRFLVMTGGGLALFMVVSLFGLGPDLQSQEKVLADVKFLSAAQISSIVVAVPEKTPLVIRSERAIASFTAITQQAQLFYPSHEASQFEFEITIQLRNGKSLVYRARIPERHLSDMAIDFRGAMSWGEIILPGGHAWFQAIRHEAS